MRESVLCVSEDNSGSYHFGCILDVIYEAQKAHSRLKIRDSKHEIRDSRFNI